MNHHTKCQGCGRIIPVVPIGHVPKCTACRYDDPPAGKPWHENAFDPDGFVSERVGFEPKKGSKAEHAFALNSGGATSFNFDEVYDRLDGKADREQIEEIVAEVFKSQIHSAHARAVEWTLRVLLCGAHTAEQAGRRAWAWAYDARLSGTDDEIPATLQELGKRFGKAGVGKQAAHDCLTQTRRILEQNPMILNFDPDDALRETE